ncbi:hypothetical protein GPR70_004679 [Salmonella enterica]|nr:hypothetical protein [Salmonella enterica]
MRPELQLFYKRKDYSSHPLRLMGECNRSYVAPRLGALLNSQIGYSRFKSNLPSITTSPRIIRKSQPDASVG